MILTNQISFNTRICSGSTLSPDEQLLNLCAILSGNEPMSEYVTFLSNKNAEQFLPSLQICSSTEDDENNIVVGMNYVTLITEGDVDTWYLEACIKKHSDGTYTMDYLQRLQK